MKNGDFLLDYIWIGRIPRGKGPAYLLNKYGFPSSLYKDPTTLYRFPNKQVMFYDEYNKGTFPIGTIIFIRKDK